MSPAPAPPFGGRLRPPGGGGGQCPPLWLMTPPAPPSAGGRCPQKYPPALGREGGDEDAVVTPPTRVCPPGRPAGARDACSRSPCAPPCPAVPPGRSGEGRKGCLSPVTRAGEGDREQGRLRALGEPCAACDAATEPAPAGCAGCSHARSACAATRACAASMRYPSCARWQQSSAPRCTQAAQGGARCRAHKATRGGGATRPCPMKNRVLTTAVLPSSSCIPCGRGAGGHGGGRGFGSPSLGGWRCGW